MNLDVFYIVISIIFVVLLLAALVLWAIDSRMDYKRKKIVAQKIENGRGLRVESEDLILKVKDGSVEILDDVPAYEAAAEKEEVPEEEAAPIVVPMQEELSVSNAASRIGEITENSIVFERAEIGKQTFTEKYEALSEESKTRYDEVVAYILSHSDCKKSVSSTAATFKCKTDKIARVVIKRGVVVLNFMLTNTELNRFVKEEGIKKIKISPVVVRLESDMDVVLAKQTIDITIENLHEEQLYRKEKNKERRRELRRQKNGRSLEDKTNN